MAANSTDQQATGEGVEPLSFDEELEQEFGINGMIQFSKGDNDLPRVWLTHPHRCVNLIVCLR